MGGMGTFARSAVWLHAQESAARGSARNYLRHILLEAEYLNVEWQAMAGMRDRLIHDHFGVDYEIVWDVVQNHIITTDGLLGPMDPEFTPDAGDDS